MKNLFSIIFILLSCLFIASCAADDNNDTDSYGRTVLIYCCADNNLCSLINGEDGLTFIDSDLKEMVDGAKKISKNDQLLVYVDKINSESYIARLTDKGMEVVRKFDRNFKSTPSKNMHEVIEWTFNHYPAEGFGLLFWGHGTGWTIEPSNSIISSAKAISIENVQNQPDLTAYGYDDGTTGKPKWSNINMICEALNGIPKLDFLMFDCCHMQCIECAYDLKNYCSYLIGCPSEIPGAGAPYQLIVPNLFIKDSRNAAKQIVLTYSKYYSDNRSYSLPLSVIDTKYIEEFTTETSNVLHNAGIGYEDLYNINLENAVYYGNNIPEFAYNYCFYDIKDVFLKTFKDIDLTAWNKTLDKLVFTRSAINNPARWQTAEEYINFSDFTLNNDNFGGMSMFIPRKKYNILSSSYLNPNESIKETAFFKALFKDNK